MAILSDNIISKLNYRIQQEEMSSRIYFGMANWLEFIGYTGAAKLWNKYSEEEKGHAKIVVDYLLDLNILPNTPELEEPQTEFKSLEQIIALSYKHEVDITNQCKELASISFKEGDFMTFVLAQKFVTEQVEELKKTQLWIDKLSLFGNDKIALRLLDNEMGETA